MKRRFKVQYARPDGNVYEAQFGCSSDPFFFLKNAQEAAELEREEHKRLGWTSCVFVTDLDNEEAGDLSDVDPEEYQDAHQA